MKSIAFALLLSLLPLEPAAAQAPASSDGAVFVAYYWRAKPGQLEAYNQYIKTMRARPACSKK
jgi:hypothetical protein